MTVLGERGSKKASHDDICNGALKHYGRLSSECSDWSSVVPKAIEFYRKHGEGRITGDSLVDVLVLAIELWDKAYRGIQDSGLEGYDVEPSGEAMLRIAQWIMEGKVYFPDDIASTGDEDD